MFKRITINLSGPICSCERQNISWGIWLDDKNQAGLTLTCKDCNTQLKIPNSKFVAGITSDVPYPADKKKEKEEKKEKKKESSITEPDGSNVIPFPKKDERKDKND